jgi:hypothetical protein
MVEDTVSDTIERKKDVGNWCHHSHCIIIRLLNIGVQKANRDRGIAGILEPF